MIYTFAEFELDTRSFELRRYLTGDVIGVEPQVFDVLRFLVENPGRVVTKEELLDAVWGTRFVTESALTSRIKDARRAVGDDGRAQQVIRTAHGRGYRFVAPVVGRADHEPAAPAACDRPALLERSRELATLVSALDAGCTRGRGTVVLVSGEAGLGKTTLVRAFADEAVARGVRVLSGGCDDLVTPRTLGPVRDIAHGLGGPLAAALAGGADPEQVFSVLPDVLAEAPMVLVIEDLHWADDATLDVIRFLARRVPTLPTVVVITYRDEEVGDGHRLRRVLGNLTGEWVRRLALAPLSLDAVATMAGDGGVPAGELYAVTRGNPFFVSEVLAARELGVPPTVRDAVLSRVDGLGPAARQLLQHAAVIPSRAERWLLAELTHPHSAAAEAEGAGVLGGDEGHVWFRHELARQAVEGSLTAAARVRANQQVLDVLAKHDDIEPARLVHHAEQAGDTRALVDHAPVAAEEAIRLGSYSQAIDYLELLLAQAATLPDRTVAVACSHLSYALYMVNRFADSAAYGWRGSPPPKRPATRRWWPTPSCGSPAPCTGRTGPAPPPRRSNAPCPNSRPSATTPGSQLPTPRSPASTATWWPSGPWPSPTRGSSSTRRSRWRWPRAWATPTCAATPCSTGAAAGWRSATPTGPSTSPGRSSSRSSTPVTSCRPGRA